MEPANGANVALIYETRNYQEEILQIALQENVIIYLPTGSGKTYIVTLLIRELGECLESGKRTFFLVNTVPLVEQQANALAAHLPYNIGRFTGDMNLDGWREQQWRQEMDSYPIIVMTTQIFLNIIQHNFYSLEYVNLLIFDECHNASNDHAMRQLAKLFNNVPEDSMPRIVGLTATLLNKNVSVDKLEEEIRGLEITLNSKIITSSDPNSVSRFSANPDVKFIYYSSQDDGDIKKFMDSADEIINQFDNIRVFLEKNLQTHCDREEEKTTKKLSASIKSIMNGFEDYKIQLEAFGLAGALKVIEAHFINLYEEAFISSSDWISDIIYSSTTLLNTHFNSIENILKKYELSQIFEKFSSSKLNELLKLLKAICANLQPKENIMVFVKRRATAKILYTILVDAIKLPEFSKLKPTFILGQNKKGFNMRIVQLGMKQFKRIMAAFRLGDFNLMISTDILEEGIDIPDCSHVIKFDEIVNYRSFIQSKGRCRKQGGLFYMFVEEKCRQSFLKKYFHFKDTEARLKDILYKSTRDSPTLEEINVNLYNDIIPPYYVDGEKSGACLTAITSMSLLYQYCNSLCSDGFTNIEPYWYKIRCVGTDSQDEFLSKVEMPVESGIIEPIEGDSMSTKKLAKFSTSFKICKQLFLSGELDNALLPVNRLNTLNSSTMNYYPNWGCDKDVDNIIKIDDNRYIIVKVPPHTLKDPFLLNADANVVKCQLHLIKLSPNTPDDYWNNIYEHGTRIGLLTMRKLPKICKYSLYIHSGEITVQISTNVNELFLSKAEFESIKHYNVFMYRDVANCFKPFFLFSATEKTSNLLVVPLDLNNRLDFNIIHKYREKIEVKQLTYTERKNLEITSELYTNSIIIPWYRIPQSPCIVMEVCSEMTPLTSFPNSDYKDYNEYFSDKYDLTVYNKGQPLVQIKNVRSCSNFLIKKKIKKRELKLDYNTHLIPEFCTRQDYPGHLWVKTIIMPSILFRLENLLKADALNGIICKFMAIPLGNFKCNKLPIQTDDPLEDIVVLKDTEIEKFHQIMNRLMEKLNGGAMGAVAGDFAKDLYNIYDDFELDFDIEYLKSVSFFDLAFYCSHLKSDYYGAKSNHCVNDDRKVPSHFKPAITYNGSENMSDFNFKPIKLLEKSLTSEGPEQWELLQALTSNSANDVFNFERVETLGDSLLKCMVSFYLFNKFETYNEGMLVEIKGKLVGNENLFYCGLKKRIHEFINVTELCPSINWYPPSFNSVDFLKDTYRTGNVVLPFNNLYDFKVPLNEQIDGVLSEATESLFRAQIASLETQSESHFCQFIDDQVVQKKRISDCVEAIIGIFLKCKGIFGGIKLLQFFDILPDDDVSRQLMIGSPKTAFIDSAKDVSRHIRNLKGLEEQLGYQFKDKSFLLQALSHLSYTSNRMTRCYQRLEFLGDAILDFLITCHIFETCEDFTPGQITDLRSALVNNVNFAALTVRNNFHKHILYNNQTLYHMITKFIQIQNFSQNEISESVLFLISEEDCDLAEYLEAPKLLSDIWESLAGAVFLDSNYSLSTVWEVFYKLMWKEIESFKKDIPKNPIRLLDELKNILEPKFLNFKSANIGKTACCLQITINGAKKCVYGYGNNKYQAKRAAAKQALRKYNHSVNKSST